MPLYKYLGNKILTTAQNSLLGSHLTEFHSGYRIYSVTALKKLHFSLNSNDFHFDTEIIIQLLNAKMRIKELPIPTYYGDEICRVNGTKYAKDVMVATLQNAFHRCGLLHQRRFDPVDEDNRYGELKLGYPSSHTYAIEAIPSGAKVLDIDSSSNGVAAELVRKGCQVAVVDRIAQCSPVPEGITAYVQDPKDPPTFALADYEYLLMLDVIEHLPEPENFIEELRKQFDFNTRTLILTTPNVAFIVQRVMLALGQFNYGTAGILDRTHVRLYTFRSIQRLLRDAGFRVKEVRGIPAPFPKVLGPGLLGRAALAGNLALIRLSKTLFAYQVYVVAETTPDVGFILEKARNSERPRKQSFLEV
jgi:2-polyprenyl-3-methyl-5-hydroxy-6-metoxy-1,4-benzoquinol methylase